MVSATPIQNESPSGAPLDNAAISARLDEVAELFAAKDPRPYRACAYRNAAITIRDLPAPVSELLASRGVPGLTELPGIGASIARTIHQMATTGQTTLLDRLRSKSRDAAIFTTVPGVGRKTAELIRTELGIKTLFDLEQAAYDGRLAALPGIGRKRLRAVQETLAARLGNASHGSAPRNARAAAAQLWQPSVEELLSIDEEYRTKAEQGRLLLASPLRFNPEGKAWLPILHARRERRCYTAHFSNSPRAHQLGLTHDWVVIYREGSANAGQWTVTTSRRGPLQNCRIVRGREDECEQYYAKCTDREVAGAVPGGHRLSSPSRAHSPKRRRSAGNPAYRQKTLFPSLSQTPS